MAVTVNSLDNISNTMLDFIKDKFKDREGYRIIDDRDSTSFGKRREYFLLSNNSLNNRARIEWSFIWIGNNLWQFNYCNTNCNSQANWKNPLDLLNELLKS